MIIEYVLEIVLAALIAATITIHIISVKKLQQARNDIVSYQLRLLQCAQELQAISKACEHFEIVTSDLRSDKDELRAENKALKAKISKINSDFKLAAESLKVK
jgi:hypothetical protein